MHDSFCDDHSATKTYQAVPCAEGFTRSFTWTCAAPTPSHPSPSHQPPIASPASPAPPVVTTMLTEEEKMNQLLDKFAKLLDARIAPSAPPPPPPSSHHSSSHAPTDPTPPPTHPAPPPPPAHTPPPPPPPDHTTPHATTTYPAPHPHTHHAPRAPVHRPPLPNFTFDGRSNVTGYIARLERYFNAYGVDEDFKTDCLIGTLVGSASTWLEGLGDDLLHWTYSGLKAKLLANY